MHAVHVCSGARGAVEGVRQAAGGGVVGFGEQLERAKAH